MKKIASNKSYRIRRLASNNRVWIIADSNIQGKGVYAVCDIPAGTLIEMVTQPINEIDSIERLKQVGNMVITEFGSKINHQCNCNCCLKKDLKGRLWCCALRDIKSGEELVADYRKNPPEFNRDVTGYIEL